MIKLYQCCDEFNKIKIFAFLAFSPASDADTVEFLWLKVTDSGPWYHCNRSCWHWNKTFSNSFSFNYKICPLYLLIHIVNICNFVYKSVDQFAKFVQIDLDLTFFRLICYSAFLPNFRCSHRGVPGHKIDYLQTVTSDK